MGDQLNQSSGSFELVLSAVFLGFVGYLLDGWIGTAPWFMVTFAVLGLIGAGMSLYYRYHYEIDQMRQRTEALREEAISLRSESSGSAGGDRS